MDWILSRSSNSLSTVTNNSASPFNAVERIGISSLSSISIFVSLIFSDKMESWVTTSKKSDIISWGIPILVCRTSLYFGDQWDRNNKLMGNQDFSENISTKATRGGGTNQHIGIKKHPHDIWGKISSSLKYPRDSANGITLFLISSNCSRRS